MQLVDVQRSLVRLAGNAESSPVNFELHGRSSVAIAAVVDD
jgi:hypothetical protein